MNTHKMIKRQQRVNLLVWYAMLRISGLIDIGMIRSMHWVLDGYLLSLRQGNDYFREAQAIDSPQQWVGLYVTLMAESFEKTVQNLRHNFQIAQLAQDEVRIWATRIEQALVESVED